ANGSGTSVGDVNRLVKQFSEMQKMMKKMGGMGLGKGKGKKGLGKKGRALPAMGGMPGGFPNFN
ncbi:MAG: signal recognition particle protein, partial [Ilumatobacteraceae bacterium]